jgi:hypothetical protein
MWNLRADNRADHARPLHVTLLNGFLPRRKKTSAGSAPLVPMSASPEPRASSYLPHQVSGSASRSRGPGSLAPSRRNPCSRGPQNYAHQARSSGRAPDRLQQDPDPAGSLRRSFTCRLGSRPVRSYGHPAVGKQLLSLRTKGLPPACRIRVKSAGSADNSPGQR